MDTCAGAMDRTEMDGSDVTTVIVMHGKQVLFAYCLSVFFRDDECGSTYRWPAVKQKIMSSQREAYRQL
jgi:hypothetical protein